MKSLVLLACAVWPTLAPAQVKMYNTSLTDSLLPLVYHGVDNKLTITGVHGSRLNLTSGYGRIRPDFDNNNVFYYRNDQLVKYDTFRLYDGNKLLLTTVLEQKFLARPVTSVAQSTDSVISKEKLAADPVIDVFRDDLFINNFYVVKFEMDIYPQTGEPVLYGVTEGDRLTPEQVKKIQSLQKSDIIRLYNVIANCPGCLMKSRLKPVEIRVE